MPTIAAYALARLAVRADGAAVHASSVGAQQIDEHTDGAYTVLPLRIACAGARRARSSLDYTLFADTRPAAPRPAAT